MGCDNWTKDPQFFAATHAEIHPPAAVARRKRNWAAGFGGEDEEEGEREQEDDVHPDTALRRKRMARYTNEHPSDGVLPDGSFCFLCAKQGEANPIREEMERKIDALLGKVHKTVLW
jgi:hypothetical protein